MFFCSNRAIPVTVADRSYVPAGNWASVYAPVAELSALNTALVATLVA